MMDHPIYHDTSYPHHAHDSSGEYSPNMLYTPSFDSTEFITQPRNVLQGLPVNVFPSIQSPEYIPQPAHPGLAGIATDSFELDAMKRALEHSLPNNPMNGNSSQIDSSKRQRHTPLGPLPSTTSKPFTPRVSSNPYHSHTSPYMNGMTQVPQSPLHLGGPLGTPAQMNMNSPVIPQSPFTGIGFGNLPFMGFPVSPIVSPSMDPNTMTGNYGPAAAAAAAAAAGNVIGRTIYVGNLPPEASVDELLNLVRFGPIEMVRLFPEKAHVFISFLDGSTAAAFYADATVKKLALRGQQLAVRWGHPSYLSKEIARAVSEFQATRNVFVGNLEDTTSEQDLRNACSVFGPIDQVKIVRDKNIGFIHFLSIATAIKVVAELPLQEGWKDKRVSYGKDRCAYVPKAQQAAVRLAQAQAAAAVAAHHQQVAQMPGSPFAPFTPMTPSFAAFGTPQSGFGSPIFGNAFGIGPQFPVDVNPANNRNVYLGNIHPDTTTEELCNNIRSGPLSHIRHLKDKNIAFVTFIDPAHAAQFRQHVINVGITIHNRRLKANWGKHSGPLSLAIRQAFDSGATRNVYVGLISDMKEVPHEKLQQDFEEYGEIEMINFLPDKGAAFVNFTNITSAIKAVEFVKEKEPYQNYRISYGKDRCANPPRVNGERGTPPSARRQGLPSTRSDESDLQSQAQGEETEIPEDGETAELIDMDDIRAEAPEAFK